MKQILLTLAIVVLALGAWFFLGSTTSSTTTVVTPLPPAPAQVELEPERGAAELETASLESTEEPARSAVEVDGDPGVPAQAAALDSGLTLTEEPEDGITYQVVIEGSDAPLPGAILTTFSERAASQSGAEQMMMSGAGIDAILDALGTHYRCDDEGRVRIEAGDRDVLMRGRGVLEGKRYSGMAEADTGERLVRVRPEAGFDVTVVDAGGAPVAGAPVQLNVQRSFGDEAQRMAFNTVETDAAGRAYLANSLLALADQVERMTDDGGSVLVSLGGLHRERPEQEVDWRSPELQAIELVAPPMGRVEVTLTLAGGGEVPAGGLVLHRADATRVGMGVPSEGSVIRPIQGGHAGPVVFEGVERGMAFGLTFQALSEDPPLVLEDLTIPAGQELLEVDFALELEVLRLAGRVLAPDGRPLAGEEVHLGRHRSWRVSSELIDSVVTDADGRFEVPAPWFEGGVHKLWHDTEGGEELAVVLPQPGEVAEVRGLVDVGDLRLEGEVVLASGRVVDADGEGLAVGLELREPRYATASGFTEIAALGEDGQVRNPRPARRHDAQRWETLSSDSGAFSFRGRSGDDTLTLTVESELYLASAPIEVQRGSTDLVVTLERAARFHFELPEMHPMMRRSIFLRVLDDGDDRSYHSVGDGWSPPLTPGIHDFYLALGGDADQKLYEGTVQLAAGEQRELGLLTFSRPILHHEVHVELVGETNPNRVRVQALGEETDADGQVREVFVGHGVQDWRPSAAEGEPQLAIHHIFSTEPIDRVQVRLGSAHLVHPVAEGKTTIVFDPSQHRESAELTSEQEAALRGLGYL